MNDIPLGAPTGRFDYESLDSKTGLLFIADLAGGRVLVVDIRANRLAKAIQDIPSVHGVLAVPERGRVYASATSANEVVEIGERSLAVAARTPAGDYPNRMAWAPGPEKLYVSDNAGHSVAVIDGASNRLLKTIPIGDVADENGLVSAFDVTAAAPRKIGEAKLADNAHVVGADPATHRVFLPLRNLNGRAVLRVMEPTPLS